MVVYLRGRLHLFCFRFLDWGHRSLACLDGATRFDHCRLELFFCGRRRTCAAGVGARYGHVDSDACLLAGLRAQRVLAVLIRCSSSRLLFTSIVLCLNAGRDHLFFIALFIHYQILSLPKGFILQRDVFITA